MTSDRQRETVAAIRADQQFWRDLVAEVGRERPAAGEGERPLLPGGELHERLVDLAVAQPGHHARALAVADRHHALRQQSVHERGLAAAHATRDRDQADSDHHARRDRSAGAWPRHPRHATVSG